MATSKNFVVFYEDRRGNSGITEIKASDLDSAWQIAERRFPTVYSVEAFDWDFIYS